MVSITPTEDSFVFEVIGMHKLWALKSKITVARKNVVSAQLDTDPVPFWKGFRAPGTEVPGIIAAGTFYQNGRNFWDVMNRSRKTIIVNLENEYYQKLIIDVKYPQTAIDLLNQQ